MSTATKASVVESVKVNEPTNDEAPANNEQPDDQPTEEPDAKKAKIEEESAASDSQPTKKRRGRSSQTSFERAKAEAEALTKDLPKEEGEGRRTRSKTRPPVTTPAKEEPEKATRARRTPSKAEKNEKSEVTPKKPVAKPAGKGKRGRPPKNKVTADASASDADDAHADEGAGEPANESQSNVEAEPSNKVAEVKENGQAAPDDESKMDVDPPASETAGSTDKTEDKEAPSSDSKADPASSESEVAEAASTEPPATENSAISSTKDETSTETAAISSVETDVEAKKKVSTPAEPAATGDATCLEESKTSTEASAVE